MGLSQKHARSYKQRDAILAAHGYRSYTEYLSSSLWRSKRRRFIAAVDGSCVACGSLDNLVVHHRCYSEAILFGTEDDYLVLLCNSCHERVELTSKKTKRGLLHVDAELMRLCPCLTKLTEHLHASPSKVVSRRMTPEAIEKREARRRKRRERKDAARAARLKIPETRRLEIIANLLVNPRF